MRASTLCVESDILRNKVHTDVGVTCLLAYCSTVPQEVNLMQRSNLKLHVVLSAYMLLFFKTWGIGFQACTRLRSAYSRIFHKIEFRLM